MGGPYSLFDQNGTPVTDATFHGHYVLLYFGFTFCPDICPNEINKLIEILNVLGKNVVNLPCACLNLQSLHAMYLRWALDNGLKPHQPRIKPVFITIDPKRDTIGQLKYYSRDFDSRLTWLTGTTEQIETVSRSHRVYTGKVSSVNSLNTIVIVCILIEMSRWMIVTRMRSIWWIIPVSYISLVQTANA